MMSSTVGQFLKANAVFTAAEMMAACNNSQSDRNLLHNAVKAGRVRKVKKGLYASNSGRFEGSTPLPQAIASKAAPDAALCYASAFSLFSGNQDILRELPFYTDSQIKSFAFDGIRYRPLPYPSHVIRTRAYRIANGLAVTGTTREQTIADSIASVARAGGPERLLRSLSAVQYLDVEPTVAMALRYGASAAARLGWILERKADSWDCQSPTLETLMQAIGRGPYFFGSSAAKVAFDSKWRLYLPENPLVMEEWLYG